MLLKVIGYVSNRFEPTIDRPEEVFMEEIPQTTAKFTQKLVPWVEK